MHKEMGIFQLTKLFNVILKSKTMPDRWRGNTLVPICKNKGDVQSCENYKVINLMSYTIKTWEREIVQWLRRETKVSKTNLILYLVGQQ